MHAIWLWTLLLSALTGCLIKFGVLEGELHLHQLRYFTILSNLLAVAYPLCALAGRRRVWCVPRGMAVLSLTVTAVVYHAVLAAVFGPYVPFTLEWMGNILVHTVTPMLMVGEWLVFRGEKRLRWYHPWGWMLFPLAYFAMTVGFAKLGIRMPNSATPYPYPFLDVWSLGWGIVLRNVAGLAVCFLGLGYILVGLDWLRRKRW